MTIGLSTGLAILSFILVIGPLIFFHELGHFLVARLFKIKVEEFGIGYPPRMLTLFERNGTKYTLNWLPLGGFMRPAGEGDPTVEGGFDAASRLARFSTLFAGPGANLVIAFVLLLVMFMVGAPEEQPGALVTLVEPGSPAESAGLEPGDVIIEADGVFIETYDDLREYIFANTGEDVVLTVRRNEAFVNLTLTPRTEWPEGQGPTGIQMQPIVELERYGPFRATGRAFQEMGNILVAFVELPSLIAQNQIPTRYLRPVSVIGISQMGGQAMEASLNQAAAWPILQLTALISLALAITNLLPIPALDGGRILFVLIEAIRGKRISPEREAVVHFVGFALLVTAMIAFMYLDIVDPLIQ
ncbi:MAG TPA: M50 family metallopeptidase [Aggregatilineales bacterium]|nr:M50 family metallopeptidase [Aggregatilineales bacterium]